MVAVLAIGGLAAGVAPASGTQVTTVQAASASLTYQCRFPSGPRLVQAAVSASLPTAGRASKPIQPVGVTLKLALPPAAVSGLASLHSATVSAVTKLGVSASVGPSGTSVVWPGTTRHPVRRPAHGGLTLTTEGTVPSVTAPSAGEVMLTAAGLSVTFTAGKAAAPAPGPATPATSATPMTSATPGAGGRAAVPAPPTSAQPPLQVTCMPVPGQHAALGGVLVTGAAHRAAPRHAVTGGKCPKLPKGGLKFNPHFPLPKVIDAPGTQVIHFPAQGCAFTTGYADARKLNGALLLSPAFTNVELTVREVVNFSASVNYADLDNIAQLDFHGKRQFPPATATFLTFGFVPTTATVVLAEHGTINIYAIGPAIPGTCKPNKFQNCVTTATVNSRLSVKIVPGSVKVNGVPLDVGTHCETPAFDAIVTGRSDSKPPYSIQGGGPLTGEVTIPKFRNCGVTENLNPIFNAAISGPRNFNLLTQGVVCFVTGGLGCNKQGLPVPPTPLRKVTG